MQRKDRDPRDVSAGDAVTASASAFSRLGPSCLPVTWEFSIQDRVLGERHPRIPPSIPAAFPLVRDLPDDHAPMFPHARGPHSRAGADWCRGVVMEAVVVGCVVSARFGNDRRRVDVVHTSM